MACTFLLLVERKCRLDPRSKNQSCQVIPPVSCNKNITCHKKCLKFNGCDTEIELILAKSACFTTPVNIQEVTICPLHRERLGIGWRRSIIQCSVPEEISEHDDTAKQKAERGLGSEAVRCYSRSLYYKPQKKIVPVGSGKQMLYVLNIMVRYSLIYVGTKDRQFLTFIPSFDLLFYGNHSNVASMKQ